MNKRKRIPLGALLFIFVFCFLIMQNEQQVGNTYLTSISEIHSELCSAYDGDPSKSDIDSAHGVISYREGKKQDLGIEYYIENGITNIPSEQLNNTINAVIMICIPWFALIGASFLLYFVTTYCFCDCCKCKGCLFNKLDDFKDMKLPFFASMLFNGGILGISIYCIFVTVDKPYKNMKCLVSEIFSNASDGSYNDTNWLGMKILIQNFQELQSNLAPILVSANKLAQNITINQENATADYDELIKQNSILGNMSSQDSYYYQMLPYLANGTKVINNDIFLELQSLPIAPQTVLFSGFFNSTLKSMLNLKNQSQELSKNGQTITSSLNLVQSNSATIMTGLQTAIENFYTLTQDWDGNKNDLVLYYKIYFLVFVGLSGAIILVSIFIYCDSCIGLSKCVYAIVWIIYFLLVIVSFAASGIFEIKIEVLVESYNHFKDITTNQTKLNTINQLIPDTNFKDFLSQCLYQGGNVSQILEIQYLSLINNFSFAVNQFKEESSSFLNNTQYINKSLIINSGYIDSFTSFKRVDEKEPSNMGDVASLQNAKYLIRTAVKHCNNKQKSSVPDNMTYCDTNAYQYDPSNESAKNFTPSSTQPVCFQSMTFSTNRSLISKYIPNCDTLNQIDTKYQNQVNIWQNVSKQENLIIENYKNITKMMNANIDIIEKYIGEFTQQLSILADTEKGLIPAVQNQNCSFFSAQIDRVYLGFYGLIQFYNILWILNITIACLVFLNGISMFRVLIDIYYIQKQPDQPIPQQNESKTYEILPTRHQYQGRPDLTKQ